LPQEEEIEARSSQLKGEPESKEAKMNEKAFQGACDHVIVAGARTIVSKAERELEGATTFADETKSAVRPKKKQISDESDTIEERNQAAKDARSALFS
jgi:hypothetical protein